MFIPEPSTRRSVQGAAGCAGQWTESPVDSPQEGSQAAAVPSAHPRASHGHFPPPALWWPCASAPLRKPLPWHEASLEALLKGRLGDTACRSRGPTAGRLGFQTLLHGWRFCTPGQVLFSPASVFPSVNRGQERPYCRFAVKLTRNEAERALYASGSRQSFLAPSSCLDGGQQTHVLYF